MLLQGFTVVEIGHPFTEYAGQVLAGLGASVWLVEPPGGTSTRERQPFAPGVSGSRRSISFLARNAGKRSVVIEPGAAGESRLGELLARADAVLDVATSPFHDAVRRLAAARSITITEDGGLGTSPIVTFAASGGLSSSGWPHQPPCNAPGWLAMDAAGIYAALFAIVASRCALPEGGRLDLEIPFADAALAAITPWTRPLHSYGMVVAGQGAGAQRLGAGPYPIIPCADGFVRVLMATPRQWSAYVDLIGRPEALAGPEWDVPQYRVENFELLTALAEDALVTRKMADLVAEGQAAGLTITPVLNIPQFMADPHVASRAFFAPVSDPDLGTVLLPRPPVRFPREAPLPPREPAPALGQHTAEAAAATPAPVRKQPTADVRAPLAGLRVLDLGVGAVVPEAASLLALLGADVIKVESRYHVDFLRQLGLNGPGDINCCPTFNQLNLGVRSIAADMRTPEARQLMRDLVPSCDILMENMRGPVMGRWGLDYDSVRELRPDIIYFSSQGLGAGPYGEYQTYGPNLQAFSGATSLWAHPDDPYPVGSTLNHPDHVAGKQALVAIVAALRRRDVTGEGCYIDGAQFEAAAAMLADRFLQHQLLPGTVQPLGNRSLDFAPHGCYPCQGEERWCAVAVEDDAQWQAFAAAVGEPWTDEPAYASTAGRLEHTEALDAHVAAWTRPRPPEEVQRVLRAAGVPASVVITGEDLVEDTDRHEDGLFACLTHPQAGPRWYTGLPIVLPGGERYTVRRPPLLGEHDEAVLYDLLGISGKEASALAASGAIGF